MKKKVMKFKKETQILKLQCQNNEFSQGRKFQPNQQISSADPRNICPSS